MDIKVFIDNVMKYIPREQLPSFIVVPDDEYRKLGESEYIRGNGSSLIYQYGVGSIKIYSHSHHNQEEFYKSKLEQLEDRLKRLER